MMPASSRVYRRCVSSHCSSSSTSLYAESDGAVSGPMMIMMSGVDDNITTGTGTTSNNRSKSSTFNSFLPRQSWQPRHLLTRRTAKVVREVQSIWNTRLGPTTRVVPADKIKLLFNDMKLFPSTSQINEMLQSAKQCASRSNSHYLTLSEFFIFATELKRSSHTRIYRKDYFSRILEKNGYEKKIQDKRITRRISKYDVFLGGSCNPTTWRQDEAIPLFKQHGVSFYNPQVSVWREELIEVEHHAKEDATVLFYVIDNKTRNVVGSIELSYFAGSQRNLIPVVYSYEGPGQFIAQDRLSELEYEELRDNICLIKQLSERRGIRVFDNIADAVKYTVKVLKHHYKSDSPAFVNYKFMEMKEAFETIDKEHTGRISASDVNRAIQILTNHRRTYPISKLKKNIRIQIDDENKNNADSKINFEQFCKIVSELKLCDEEYFSDDTSEGKTNFSNFFRSLSTPYECGTSNGFQIPVDIYLGGDCIKQFDWRNEIAIPLIRKSCLTFFNPESMRNDGKQLISQTELNVVDNSSVLLFVVPGASPSLSTMSLASFYIPTGTNIVLCVQHLPDDYALGSDKLSKTAINDYNRGRLYLIDLAKRQNIPVCDSVASAVELAIEKCLLR